MLPRTSALLCLCDTAAAAGATTAAATAATCCCRCCFCSCYPSLKSHNLRQDKLKCKFLDNQAREKGNSDDCSNSEDDRSATDDSIVASGLDDPDGSYEIYALGMSFQAEAAGFTVPLHKTRYVELNRPNIADSVLESLQYNKSELLKSLPPLLPKDE